MATEFRPRRKLLVMVSAVFVLFLAAPAGSSGKKFDGQWLLTVSIPESPGSSTIRTFNIGLDVAPREGLVGRLTVTDDENGTVGGVWRQVFKRIWLSYELPCPNSAGLPCATLIITGKNKVETGLFKKGKVIVMWDTPNGQDPSFYDTSVGFVTGNRVF